MLYITTRSNRDAFTAYKTLTGDFPQDGGLYIPFQIPTYTPEEISALKEKGFSETIADILNLFFSAHISSWDVDCSIGRNPAKIVKMIHKVTVAELWHNLGTDYSYFTENLFQLLCKNETSLKVTDWPKIAIRIAMLFGVFSELMRSEVVFAEQKIDIAVNADDFSVPTAAWYAKRMGLPINNIICCCQEDSPVWDFIRKGAINTAVQNGAPALERLICNTLGNEQVLTYASACQYKRVYSVSNDTLALLNGDLFAAAVSTSRIPSVINSVLRTDGYLMHPDAAFVYGGLQDYRASTGESRPVLILAETPPK